MIKKFSEHINEDYFSKLANRKDNGNVRMENVISGNIKDIKPIKVSNLLSIADRLFEMNNGQDEFSYYELEELNLGEWRLPTKEEWIKYVCTQCKYQVINGTIMACYGMHDEYRFTLKLNPGKNKKITHYWIYNDDENIAGNYMFTGCCQNDGDFAGWDDGHKCSESLYVILVKNN